MILNEINVMMGVTKTKWYNDAANEVLMERSKMITNKIKHTALLSRLSRDDDLQGDSKIIQTQKAMLEQYASKNGFTNIIHYVDGGYSGTNFDRPDFQRLMNDIKLGKIGESLFNELSSSYQIEKEELVNKITKLESNISKQKDTEKKVKEFANIVKKYYNISELNSFILNELIHKITVYEREIINGKRVQKIEILYKFTV